MQSCPEILRFLVVIERVFVYNWDMSAGLSSVVDELVDVDVSGLCDSEIRERFIEARREIDRLERYAAALLVGVHGRGIPSGEGASSTPVWVQFQTGQRVRDARVSLATGKACESLPLVAKSWAQGEISANAAATICQGCRVGHEAVYATMEEGMVGFAADRDFVALDLMIRRYQTLCDELDEKPPEDKNGFFISEVGNRFASRGDHDALGGATIKTAVDAATDKPGEDDTRTPAQRREAALVRICRYFLDHGESPTEDSERPHIAITVPLETLVSGKFETTGDLSLASSQIRELLCSSKLQIIVLGENGTPLDVGATVYRPSRRLRRAVLHRDRGQCRYPGCNRKHGQVHHVIAFPDGSTILVNLVFLCDYHHHILHKPGWTASFDGTTFTVTNPDGRHIGST
jgi:hypothetical protein